MNKKVSIFTNSIIILGLLLFLYSLINISVPIGEIIFFVIISIITESLAIELNESTEISLGFAIGLLLVIIYPPFEVAIILFIGEFLKLRFEDHKKTFNFLDIGIRKSLFNATALLLSGISAGYIYQIFSAYPVLVIQSINILGIIFSISIYVIINLLIYTILFYLLSDQSFFETMSEFSWIVINFVALSPFGIIMALAYRNWGIFAIVLFFGPFLLARYSYSLYIDMKNIYIDTIKVLSNAIDAKDEYTAGHSHRVGQYAKLIAVEMGYYGKTLEKIESAAILHDIGKIGVEDRILNKSTSLTDHEMDEIKKHPGIGADIISDIDYLKSASDFVRYHHERYSGKGYPSGKNGEELPVEACIIALADAFDAMTTDRAYRKAFSLDKALTIIKEEKGEQFHPEVVDAFLKLVNSGRIMRVNEDLRVEEHVN